MPTSNNRFQRTAATLLLTAVGLFQQALAANAAVQSARYSGSATLASAQATPPAANSSGRFQLDAQLERTRHPSVQTSGNGRFALSAKLKPDPDSVTGSCAPLSNSIFLNGFE